MGNDAGAMGLLGLRAGLSYLLSRVMIKGRDRGVNGKR